MSFSSYSKQKMLDSANESKKGTEDELTCSVCLEQVTVGEIVRTLPCLHQVSIFTFILNWKSSSSLLCHDSDIYPFAQFHAGCIDPWLRQQGTCPVCKFRAHSGWQEQDEIDDDASDMVWKVWFRTLVYVINVRAN